MDFRNRLKFYRKQKKLTQQQLADALQTNNTNISNWEKGAAKPDITTLIQISNYFEVSVDELLFGAKKNQENAYPKRILKTHTQKGDLHTQNAYSNQFGTASDDAAPAAPHLTGDFAASDSEPVREEIYNALLGAKDRTIAAKNEIIRAKDEIIATKDAQIADLRGFVTDMRNQVVVVQSNLDELRKLMAQLQRPQKGAVVAPVVEDVAARRK